MLHSSSLLLSLVRCHEKSATTRSSLFSPFHMVLGCHQAPFSSIMAYTWGNELITQAPFHLIFGEVLMLPRLDGTVERGSSKSTDACSPRSNQWRLGEWWILCRRTSLPPSGCVQTSMKHSEVSSHLQPGDQLIGTCMSWTPTVTQYLPQYLILHLPFLLGLPRQLSHWGVSSQGG